MLPEDLFPLGYVSRAQGLKGAVRLNTVYADIVPRLKGKTVYLTKGDKQSSFLFLASRPHDKDSVVITLKESISRESAESLVGFTVSVSLSDLPAGKGNQFFPYELTGMQLVDKQAGKLGVIENVFPSPAHPVAAIQYKGAEVLIPLASPFIEEINRAEKILKLNLPEGLLEVYMDAAGAEGESE